MSDDLTGSVPDTLARIRREHLTDTARQLRVLADMLDTMTEVDSGQGGLDMTFIGEVISGEGKALATSGAALARISGGSLSEIAEHLGCAVSQVSAKLAQTKELGSYATTDARGVNRVQRAGVERARHDIELGRFKVPERPRTIWGAD